VLEVKGNCIGCGIARPNSIQTVVFAKSFGCGLVFINIPCIPNITGIGVDHYQFVLAGAIPIEGPIGCPGNRTIPGNRCGKGIFLPLIIARNPAEVERVACFPFIIPGIEAHGDFHCATIGTNVVFDGVGSACLLITTLGAGRLMGAVAVVGVGVGCTITMRLRVLGDGIMDVLHPVITQLGGNRVVPELFPGYTCDLYVITPGFQIRIAVYSLKTVVTEVIAILDCINAPKRAKCRKLCLVGQVCTALKPTCKQAVFKGSLCIRIGETQETAHIDGFEVIIVACVIGLDGAVGAAVADGHFTGAILNLTDKAARAGVHTVLACIKGAVPGALFDQALVVCVSHKAADHADAVGLRGNIHEGGDILNDRAVAFKSVIGAVKTANRADDTANVVNLGVHDNIAVDGEVLDRTRSDLTEEANAVFGTFHVQTSDGVVLSVKDTAEIVVLLAGLADGCPGLVFKVDIRCQNALDLSVALYIDLLCKPEELACVVNLIVARCV